MFPNVKQVHVMLPVISFASCVEENGEVAPKLEVSQTEVVVEPAGGEVVITFKAMCLKWIAKQDPEMLIPAFPPGQAHKQQG